MQKAYWDSDKKSFGEISDQHVQPQDQRKSVQKRTFTRWINVVLQQCDPPAEVHDLFTDIQDGRILMALLEKLSGCRLLYRFRPSSHRIFRLNNISKALAFLDDRHVKLLGIDASGIADGIPSVVLNLVWNIILYFQVKEVTGGLQRHLSSSLSSLSMSSYPSSSDLSPQPNDIGSYSCNTLPSKGRNAARKSKYHGKAIKTLLQWVQRCTSKFGVEVYDFGKSWRSGLAFLALIKSMNPDLVDLRENFSREPRENIEQAFMIADQILDIPPLLEPEDVMCTSPDEQSIITYVSMFLGHCSDVNEDFSTDTDIPETPMCGSLESDSFGGTFAHNPPAHALLRGLERSREQLLWKRWSRKSSGSPSSTSFHTNGAVTSDLSPSSADVFLPNRSQSVTEQSAGSAASSPVRRNKGRSRSILQPPSRMNAGVVNQEIQLWMDQSYSKPNVDESLLSLSSEEGMCSFSELDSDEEDAYSYILDLNKEFLLPYNLKNRVPRVKEETEKEINQESRHLEVCEMLNGRGCKHQGGSLAQNADLDLESEFRAESVLQGKLVLDKNENSSRETTNNRAVFDMEPDDESNGKEEPEEERVVRGQTNADYGEEEQTENVRLVTHGYDETEPCVDEGEETKMFKRERWQKEVEEDSSLKCSQVNEKMTVGDKEEEKGITLDEGEGSKLEEEKEEEDNVKEEDMGDQLSVAILENLAIGEIVIDEPPCEVRDNSTTRINTEEETDRKDNDCDTEDLTKNSRDVNKGEYDNEVMNSKDFDVVEEKDGGLKTKKRKLIEETAVNHHGEMTPNDTDGGVNVCDSANSCTSTYSATRHSPSEGGRILQFSAASCDITPLELKMLLVLWILLYCCLILPQMNL